jgi:1,4-alpha-glucan branching enzyme
MLYAFTENYVLPLSHDEVVHGKKALAAKMPGDHWQQLANLRLLYGMKWSQPGKKLLFMGGEIAQWHEWNHEASIDWHLLQWEPHQGVQRWVRDLNQAYRREPALHQLDCDAAGFEWIDANDYEESVISFLRKRRPKTSEVSKTSEVYADVILVVINCTPVLRTDYRVGVPCAGRWDEILNSDAKEYGGSGQGNAGGVNTDDVPYHGRDHSLNLVLPPLAVVMFKSRGQ